MRNGQNPLKGKLVNAMPPVVATVITHLPDDGSEYHSTRFPVVQYSLNTMRLGAPNVPVLIWDNGSGERLRSWLKEEYKPDYLIFSPNVGKFSARTAIFGMMPPKTIIAAADDDMGYYRGWMDESMHLLTHFPNVGCVTGYVTRTSFRWGNAKQKKWAKENATYEEGKFLPEAYEQQFARSIGRPWGEQKAGTINDLDSRVTYRGVPAYLTCSHCQFIAYKERLYPLLAYSRLAIPGEREFDENIDAAGLLRLGTIERFTWHLGNVLEVECLDTDTLEKGITSPVCPPAI